MLSQTFTQSPEVDPRVPSSQQLASQSPVPQEITKLEVT